MFDESEILFLTTAVNLRFITATQRARLIAFAEDDDLGAVTEVVVDANLMTEEEVNEAMQAIQAGIGQGAPMPNSVGREDLAGAATSASISALIGENDALASADTDKIVKTVRGNATSFDALEAASRQGADVEDDAEKSGGPAFPLPTGANAFPREDADDDEDAMREYEESQAVPEDLTIAQQLAVSRGEIASLLDTIDIE